LGKKIGFCLELNRVAESRHLLPNTSTLRGEEETGRIDMISRTPAPRLSPVPATKNGFISPAYLVLVVEHDRVRRIVAAEPARENPQRPAHGSVALVAASRRRRCPEPPGILVVVLDPGWSGRDPR
jgi:hypothetical protein